MQEVCKHAKNLVPDLVGLRLLQAGPFSKSRCERLRGKNDWFKSLQVGCTVTANVLSERISLRNSTSCCRLPGRCWRLAPQVWQTTP